MARSHRLYVILALIAILACQPATGTSHPETEPNDTTWDSGVITIDDETTIPGEHQFSGSLNDTDQVDYWEIYVKGETRLTVTMDPTANFDLYLRLADDEVYKSSTGSGTVEETVILQRSAAYAGYLTYYITVENAGSSSGTYAGTVLIEDTGNPAFGYDESWTYGYCGEEYHFKTDVTDNYGLDKVYVEYWYGDGSHTNDTLTSGYEDEYTTSIVVENSPYDLDYFFSARDIHGLWRTTETFTADVRDDIDPALGSDSTPDSTVCGEQLTFMTTASDNAGISYVEVKYWNEGGNLRRLANLTLNGGTWEQTVWPYNTTFALLYQFKVVDVYGNSVTSDTSTVYMVDDTDPEILYDNTSSTATTGDDLVFYLVIEDDVGLGYIDIEYWYDDGEHEGLGLLDHEPDDYWDLYTWYESWWEFDSVEIEYEAVGELHYFITVEDNAGNIITGPTVDVEIVDNDAPAISDIWDPSWPTTGDNCTFARTCYDNIGVDEVTLNYWYGRNGEVERAEMFQESDDGDPAHGFYSTDIVVEHTDKVLYYNFTVTDMAGNEFWEETSERQVEDNDVPLLLDDTTVLSIEGGENVTFGVNATDNIGVTKVEVIYRFGSQMGLDNYTYYDWWWDELYVDLDEWLDADLSMQLVHTGGEEYWGTLTVPSHESEVYYAVLVWDKEKNVNRSVTNTIEVASASGDNNDGEDGAGGDDGGGGAVIAVASAAGVGVAVAVSFPFWHLPLLLFLARNRVRKGRDTPGDRRWRDKILAAITAEPGIHYSQIKDRLGVSNGPLTYNLEKLRHEGEIRFEKEGRFKRFFPAGGPGTVGGAEPLSNERKVMDAVGRNPGASQSEVARLTGQSKQAVHYQVGKLMDQGMLRIERGGERETRLYLSGHQHMGGEGRMLPPPPVR